MPMAPVSSKTVRAMALPVCTDAIEMITSTGRAADRSVSGAPGDGTTLAER